MRGVLEIAALVLVVIGALSIYGDLTRDRLNLTLQSLWGFLTLVAGGVLLFLARTVAQILPGGP